MLIHRESKGGGGGQLQGGGEWAVSTNRTSPLGSFEAALNLVIRIIGHFQSSAIFSHEYLDFLTPHPDSGRQTKQERCH